MKKRLLGSIAVAALLTFASQSANAVLIDDYTLPVAPGQTDTGFISGAGGPNTGESHSPAGTGGVIGGQRDLWIEVDQGTIIPTVPPIDITGDGRLFQDPAGELSLGFDSGTQGRGSIIWDGTDGGVGGLNDSVPGSVDPNGLGGVALNGVGETQFTIQVIDTTVDHRLELTVWDTLGNMDTVTKTVLAGFAGNLNIGFAEFNPLLDFSTVGAMELFMEGINDPSGGAEIRLKLVSTTTPVSEPGTLAVLGLGLAGLGLARRRRAKRT
jgi:PEP-CTERM motif